MNDVYTQQTDTPNVTPDNTLNDTQINTPVLQPFTPELEDTVEITQPQQMVSPIGIDELQSVSSSVTETTTTATVQQPMIQEELTIEPKTDEVKNPSEDDILTSSFDVNSEVESSDENLDEQPAKLGVAVSELNKELIADFVKSTKDMDLFFGKSDYNNTTVKSHSIHDALNNIKKLGEYLDVYLPVSNIVVRVYEFENDVVKNTMPQELTTDYIFSEAVFSDSVSNRNFVNRLFENCEILTIDGASVSTLHNFENLAASDINILVLAAAVLSDKISKSMSNGAIMDTTSKAELSCEVCGTFTEVTFDKMNTLKSQYTEDMLMYFNTNYSYTDTYANNIQRSLYAKTEGLQMVYNTYVKDEKTGETKPVVQSLRYFFKEQSYIKQTTIEEEYRKFILRRWENNPIFSDLVTRMDYKSSDTKNKLRRLVEVATTGANLYSSNALLQEIELFTVITKLDKITLVEAIDPTKELISSNIKVLEVVIPLELIRNNDEKLIEYLLKTPDKIQHDMAAKIKKYGENRLTDHIFTSWKCSNPECNHDNKTTISAYDLVFFILAERINSIS